MADWFCRIPRRAFSDRLDDQPIAWWRVLLVRLHLRVCPHCIRYERSLSATRDALTALRDRDVDAND
jgi:hypothetical protein